MCRADRFLHKINDIELIFSVGYRIQNGTLLNNMHKLQDDRRVFGTDLCARGREDIKVSLFCSLPRLILTT